MHLKAFQITTLAALLVAGVCVPKTASAQTAAEQRREAASIRRDLLRANSLLKRKELQEAETLLEEIEERLDKLVSDGLFDEKNRAVQILKRELLERKSDLAARRLEGKEISFVDDVGPIFKERCFSCHNEEARGGLRLDTFAGLQKGGVSRTPLVVPRNPQRSLLVARLKAPEEKRMPKDGERLPVEEIETIAAWIKQGAKFDGEDRNAPVGEKPKPEAVIVKATGNEKVSFTEDIAPFMVNICLRCHGGRNPRSGFSLETFEKLMQGGDSGVLVVGGDLEASRMWDLVGKQDPIKMPPGQALITRTNHSNLRTWILEGAKFDGDDPAQPLRELIPGAEDERREKLAKMSAEEFVDFRRERTAELWRRVLPKEEPETVESEEFILYGNVSVNRLKILKEWADASAEEVRKAFDEESSLLFRGKLTIFVMQDRFSYEEFNHVIHRRRTPREMTGHSVVTADLEDAYIVLQNLDAASPEDVNPMRVQLTEHLTAAVLKRSGADLPEWLVRGTGLMLAARGETRSPYFARMRADVPGIVQAISKPEAVFAEGTFSPADVGPVGLTLVEFLIRGGGNRKFGRLIRTLQTGETNAPAALKEVYGVDAQILARRYLATLPAGK